jgi:hypothetical protein
MKDIKKSDITKRFPELAKAIKSEFITIENNNVTINIDEAKMANIFDNFLSKLRGPNSTAPNYVKNALANKSWNSLKTQLNEYKSKKTENKVEDLVYQGDYINILNDIEVEKINEENINNEDNNIEENNAAENTIEENNNEDKE